MNRLHALSIKAQLFLIVFIVALPAAGIIIHSGIQMRKQAIHAAQMETQRLTESIVTEQRNLIAAAHQLMSALAQLPDVKKRDAARMAPVLKDILTLNAQYSNIFMVDHDGLVWATAIPAIASSQVSDRRYFKNAAASGRLSSGEFVFSKFTGKPAIAIVYPQKDARGAFSGLIGIGFHLDYFKQLLGRSYQLPGTSYVLLDHAGVLLVAAADHAHDLGKQDDEKLFKRIQDGPDEDSFIGIGIDGRERIISYRKLRLPDEKTPYMYVRAGILLDVASSNANKTLFTNLSLLTSFLIVAFIIAWLIGKRSIVDRIGLLEDASRLLASGDLRVRVADLVPGGELGNLGRTFDHMAGQLAAREQALVESERNYREIFNSTKDTIFVHDVETGRVLEINKAVEDMYGYSREEVLRLSGHELSSGEPPYTLKEALQWIRKTLDEGPQSFEWMSKRKSGECFWVEVGLSATSIGGKGRVLAVVRDITERKQAEKKILHLNRLYSLLSNVNQAIVRTRDRQSLFETICRIVIRDGKFRMSWIGIVDEDSRTVRVAASDGFSDDYLDRLNITLTDSPEGRGPTAMAIRQASHFICNDIEHDECMGPWREQSLKNGYRSSAAFPLQLFGRTIGAFNIYAPEVGFFNEEEIGLLDELALDISFALEYLAGDQERQRAEKEQQKFVSLIEMSRDFIGIATPEGRITYLNNAALALIGLENLEEARTKMIFDFFSEDALQQARDGMYPALLNEGFWFGETRFRHFKTGASIDVEQRAFAIKDAHSRPLYLATVSRDISERKRAEQERARLLSVLERSVNEIYLFDADTLQFQYVNAGALRNLGYSREIIESMTPVDIKPEFTETSFRALIAPLLAHEKDKEVFQTAHRRSDGSLYPVEVHLQLVEQPADRMFLAIIIDITDRKRADEEKQKLQSQLLQAQKMEAVGQLAGGIAHDFNNILAAIVGYGNLIQMKMGDDDPSRLYLDQILASSERAANLTQSLLAFSRKQLINPMNINLNDVIHKVEKLLSRIIGEDIELRTSLSAGALTIFADEMQIEQILMNLATNARDAMPKGGQLHIETRRMAFDDEYVRTQGDGAPGFYAELSVTDTGAGMDEKVRERLFEPFFTTKELGRGTGLGLSIVYGIVKQNNGYITVASEIDKGTTFKIYLPIIRSGTLAVEPESAMAPPQGGTETILLAEDNQIVRSLTRDILAEFGYKVIEAADGEEALTKFMGARDRIHLLIVDVIMPKKNGRDVYEEAKKWKPEIKVLFTSGYPSDLIQKEGVLEKGLNFISKPSSPQELLKKVRDVLKQ